MTLTKQARERLAKAIPERWSPEALDDVVEIAEEYLHHRQLELLERRPKKEAKRRLRSVLNLLDRVIRNLESEEARAYLDATIGDDERARRNVLRAANDIRFAVASEARRGRPPNVVRDRAESLLMSTWTRWEGSGNGDGRPLYFPSEAPGFQTFRAAFWQAVDPPPGKGSRSCAKTTLATVGDRGTRSPRWGQKPRAPGSGRRKRRST